MKRIEAGISGSGGVMDLVPVESLAPDDFWRGALHSVCPGGFARPVQRAALRDVRMLESRRNVVVVAPTNGGKTGVGYLLLLEALRVGRRALLVEPLRALAQE